MAKKRIPKKVEQEIKEYVKVLKKDKLPIKKVYLYGSYAKGSQHKWSDIDLCIISSNFNDPWKALRYLWKKRTISDVRYTIEPVGFNPRDFNNSSLANEIKKHGIEMKV